MDTAAQDDRTLVEAVRRGERAGLEGLYRRYADRLYTYARVLVREPEAAADAVHDAFLTASQRIDQLRDPDRLRPWLYAIVRNECLRQIRDRSRSSPLDEADEPVADTADPGTDVNTAQVRELVHTAAAALNPGDREVVHLAIRHDLSSVDIGAALGVPANHAHARLSRARTQLERALGALLVARSGARDCPALAETIDGWQGTLTPTLRKRVARHIDNCASCGLLRREQLSPAALLSAYTAPAFLVVADTVWPRLAGAGPADGQATDTTDGGVTDAVDGGATGDGGSGAVDGQVTDPTGEVTDAVDGSADVESSPDATTDPSATTEPSGSADGTATPGPTAGRGDAPAAEPRNGPTGAADDRAAAGPAADPAPRSAATVAGGGAALPRAAAHPAGVTSAATHDRRRRRRLAATAGLLVLLALAGTWALAPGRRAEQVAATSGATAGRSATATTTAAAVPAATPPVVTATATGAAAPTAPGPDATGTAAAPATSGSRPGAAAPTTAPGTTAAPTTAPAVARPTTTPPPPRAFTVSASAHVRCGQDTYSLVVRATGSAAVDQAEVRWTPVGGATSTQAMTVDGASAQATVGRLRATALTWSVRMTAVDGRTAQSPTYQVADPCVRPG
ncbi:RNA polymerase sigma factor, sigma-70 family [Micromonospora echinospora]|uniref:RNA polymerase sigma factor, sigma-70 family n=1 Tax=Micromonospora echinospora TaxID=1877 RepID=A0A1C5A9I4_MICEC|nr:sigma-70 family RNA polymerase sigma factor [Micromonospora echinospora]SCF41903.1 RNA polymerase sigma factor, sigma-70 family [Micromonospora echinospora]